MKRWIYRGEQLTTDDNSEPIRLDYYLEEDVRDVYGCSCLYGIRIIMYRGREDALLMEKGTAPAISYSREFVTELLDKIIRMTVTPAALLEVIDDEMGVYLAS